MMDLDMVGVDTSVNVAAPARSPIVESLMKARMETFETRLVAVVVVVVVLVVLGVVIVFVITVIIAVIAAVVIVVIVVLVVGVPSMVVPSSRWMTMITATKMVEVRRRMIMAVGNTAIVTPDFALRHRRANLFDSYPSVFSIVNFSFLRFLDSTTGSTTWARTLAHVPPLS